MHSGGGSPVPEARPFFTGRVVEVNGRWDIKPVGDMDGGGMSNDAGNGWAINFDLQIDGANQTGVARGIYAKDTADISNPRIINCRFSIINQSLSGDFWGIDRWAATNSNAATSGGPNGQSSGGTCYNTIMQKESGDGTTRFGLNNFSTSQHHNAVFGLEDSTDKIHGHDNDANEVALTVLQGQDEEYLMGHELEGAGSDQNLEYDRYWRPRGTMLDIGPLIPGHLPHSGIPGLSGLSGVNVN